MKLVLFTMIFFLLFGVCGCKTRSDNLKKICDDESKICIVFFPVVWNKTNTNIFFRAFVDCDELISADVIKKDEVESFPGCSGPSLCILPQSEISCVIQMDKREKLVRIPMPYRIMAKLGDPAFVYIDFKVFQEKIVVTFYECQEGSLKNKESPFFTLSSDFLP